MDQRLYLAAHAPADIPGWFEPELRAKPKSPAHYLDEDTERRTINFSLSKADSSTAYGAMRDIGLYRLPPETAEPYLTAFPEIREWYERWQEYIAADEAWEREYLCARTAQWPWYWAGLVIDQAPIEYTGPMI